MTTSKTPVWFITAASSGFGKQLALEALSRGHHVIASARSTSRIADLASSGATTLSLDVTSPLATIQSVAAQAASIHGYITHLVNAAGYILVGAVEETSPEEDLATFQTNVFGTLNVSKAFLPHLRASASQGLHCTLTNFGSIGSWRGGAAYGLYSGTKWAVSGISESMRAELAPLGIQVTVVEPGYFRTGFLNAGAQVGSQTRLECYDSTVVGEMRKALERTDNNQPGDVVKGCKVIVDVLMMEGGREVPVRIPLGEDADEVIQGKCRETLGLLDEWRDVVTKTGHDN